MSWSCVNFYRALQKWSKKLGILIVSFEKITARLLSTYILFSYHCFCKCIWSSVLQISCFYHHKMFLFVLWDFLVFLLSLTFSFQLQVFCQYWFSTCSDMLIDLLLKLSTSQLIPTQNYITVSTHLNTCIHKIFFGLNRYFCPELAFFIHVTSLGTFWPK
jgi:hypothetical protein